MTLANTWNWQIPAGAQSGASFQIENPDGSPYPISGATWEFVVRSAAAGGSALVFSVTTTPNASGLLTVTTSPTSTVALTLYPAATAALAPGSYSMALWMNPGTTSALLWVTGTLGVTAVAQP